MNSASQVSWRRPLICSVHNQQNTITQDRGESISEKKLEGQGVESRTNEKGTQNRKVGKNHVQKSDKKRK